MLKLVLGAVAVPLALVALAGSSARGKEESILESADAPPTYNITGPRVSVIIPTFCEEAYIVPTLEAIRNQTYKPIEIVVSDASPYGSMTATSSVIAPFEARMVHTERKNVAFGRNLGAEAAAGEIFVFLDADCIMPCDFVERLVDNLQQPGVKLSHGTDVFGDAGFISQAGKGMTRWFKPVKYTSGRGICIRKSDFWEVGGYNEECDPIQGCREDKDLGNRVVERWGLSALCLDRSVVCVEIARRPHESRLWEHRGWREGKPVDRRVYAKPGAFGRQ